jgi:transposase InsO family protein
MDHVAVDHLTLNTITDEGYVAVLLMVDIFTVFVFLRPVKDYTAQEALHAFMDVFTMFGFPKVVQSDNGSAFVNKMTANFASELGIEQRTATAYHPRGNGAAEIRVKGAKLLLKKILRGAITDWAKALPMVSYWMNQRIASLTGSSAFTYMFARQANGFKDYRSEPDGWSMDEKQLMRRYRSIKEIIFPSLDRKKQLAQDHVEERFNNKKRIVDTEYYPPGAMVMVKDVNRKSKNEPAYTGPYTILRRTKGKSYVLLDHGNDTLFPRDVPPQQLKLVSSTASIPLEPHYQVEAIVKHRGRRGAYEYLVRWKGYGASADSWEPAGNFDSPAIIEQYWKRRRGGFISDLRGICIRSDISGTVAPND